MNSSNSNWIKAYIVDVLPCMTVALYILAFVYNLAFFSVFNINITHYLSLSDMLLSILEPMVVLGVVSLLLFWMIVFFATTFYRSLEDKNQIRLTIKAKRRIVRFRKTGFARWFIVNYAKIKKWFVEIRNKLNKKQTDNNIKAEESAKKNAFGTRHPITLFFLIIVACLYVFFDKNNANVEQKGLLNATLWLILPLWMASMFALCDIILAGLNNSLPKKSFFIRSYKATEIIAAVLLFYIYALVVFYTSGLESGKYTMDNDLAKFEIRTSDGTVFNDSTYRYIDIMNDKVFLLEKETDYKVILDKEGLVFLKIVYKDEINNSIIDTFIKKEMWKDRKNREVETDSIQ